ncbi:MAG: FMN-binding negative transcriptional regulator [Pseudomonadota bacterium]
MHPAPAFRHANSDYHDRIIRETGFANLFTMTPEGPRVAHTPVVLHPGRRLRFHLARGNILTRTIESEPTLIVINGPDAYISARWYKAANQVPTWNYIALECEGPIQRLDDAELPAFLEALSAEHEARQTQGQPWTMDKMDNNALNALLRGIVGFEMQIKSVRETVKLSQNKPDDERARLIQGLEAEGKDAMAAAMRGLN